MTKEKNLAPILFAAMRQENTKVFLKTLLDSGAGASLISRKYCTTLAAREEQAHWVTIAGKFSTKGTVETQFQLTELNPTATVTYKFHVAESLGIYDMILGRDLLNQLGLTLDFSTATVTWEEASVPMKETTATAMESLHIDYPKGIDNMVGRIAGDDYKKILEAKYEKADLHKKIMQDSPHLEMAQQTDLLNVLKK